MLLPRWRNAPVPSATILLAPDRHSKQFQACNASLKTEPPPGKNTNAAYIRARLERDSPHALDTFLHRMEKSHQWWIGDWANFGERRNYADLKKMAEEADCDYGTLRNNAHVARRFEMFRRLNTLSFDHHLSVAALPDEAAFRLLVEDAGFEYQTVRVYAYVARRFEVLTRINNLSRAFGCLFALRAAAD
jgi:hypothetical protein